MSRVEILSETIRLDQFLKWSGVAPTGGRAKLLIQGGLVTVNGEVEQRRGRLLVPGDLVGVEGVGEFEITKSSR